jgi:hypothetical protein
MARKSLVAPETLQQRSVTMGQAIFVADDPADQTTAKLEDLVPQIHGVTTWQIRADGEVALEYDETTISLETIAEAFAGLGFRVKPLHDDPDAGDATRSQNTVRGYDGGP